MTPSRMYSSKLLSASLASGLTHETTKTVMPLIDAPFDERFFRREIENVELVDPRRHDQRGDLQHLFRRRFDIESAASTHSGTRLCLAVTREVAANVEHGRIRLADLEGALSGLDVFRQACACRARDFRHSMRDVSRNNSGLVSTKFDGEIALAICLT